MPRISRTLSAAEAAARLGVKVETIYAYVSRGLLKRGEGPDGERRFDAAEVERLAARGRRASITKPAALLVTSALTEVTDGGLTYRGKDAVALAAERSFEQVAEWLWGVEEGETAAFVASKAAVALARAVQSALPDEALPLERLRVIATVLGTVDPMRYETSPAAVVATARALIAGMVEGLPQRGAPASARRPYAERREMAAGPRGAPRSEAADVVPEPQARAGTPPLAGRLFTQLSAARPLHARVHLLDFAMGLCADHALSPSTLAVRIAASQRADPYGIVQTGLGALSGALHGAASLSAEELLSEVESGADPRHVIGARLRRGERIPGFGHALHARVDPRAAALLARLSASFERNRALSAANSVQEVMRSRGLPAPNIDWALAVFVRAAGMVRGASEAIMAIARVAGWVAHALEEYRAPTKFPLRALYVGPPAERQP